VKCDFFATPLQIHLGAREWLATGICGWVSIKLRSHCGIVSLGYHEILKTDRFRSRCSLRDARDWRGFRSCDLMRIFSTFCICCALFCTSAKAEFFKLRGPGGFNVVGPFPYGLPLQVSLIVTFSPPDLPAPSDVSGSFSIYRVDVYANGSHVFFACGSNQGADCGYRYIGHIDGRFNIVGGPPFVLTENLTIDVSVQLSTPGGQSSFPVQMAIDLPEGYRISRVPEIQREMERRR